jgi:anti-anti-sigma regulatory factor
LLVFVQIDAEIGSPGLMIFAAAYQPAVVARALHGDGVEIREVRPAIGRAPSVTHKTTAKKVARKAVKKRRRLSPEARAKVAQNLVKPRAARARNLKASKKPAKRTIKKARKCRTSGEAAVSETGLTLAARAGRRRVSTFRSSSPEQVRQRRGWGRSAKTQNQGGPLVFPAIPLRPVRNRLVVSHRANGLKGPDAYNHPGTVRRCRDVPCIRGDIRARAFAADGSKVVMINRHLVLTGDLDFDARHEFAAATFAEIMSAATAGTEVELDCSTVESVAAVDDTVIGMLVTLGRAARRNGSRLILLWASTPMRDQFEAMGVAQFFDWKG